MCCVAKPARCVLCHVAKVLFNIGEDQVVDLGALGGFAPATPLLRATPALLSLARTHSHPRPHPACKPMDPCVQPLGRQGCTALLVLLTLCALRLSANAATPLPAFSVADLRTQLDAALERLDEAGIAQTKVSKRRRCIHYVLVRLNTGGLAYHERIAASSSVSLHNISLGSCAIRACGVLAQPFS